MELEMTEYQKLLSKREFYISYIDLVFKRCLLLDETTIENGKKFRQKLDIRVLSSIIRLYIETKATFFCRSTQKTFSQALVNVWKSQFLYERRTKNFFSVQRLVREIRA